MKDGDTNKDFLSSKRFDFFKKFYSLTANYFNWHYFIKKLLILHSLSKKQFCHGTSINETNCCSTIMEIYNENAYDLLDKRNIERKLENWSKVSDSLRSNHDHFHR